MNASVTLPPLPEGAAPRPRSLAEKLGTWWNQLSIYLPVLLMGLLAMGSYWVVSQSPAPAEPRPPRPVSQEPDYFMRDFSVRTFDALGHLKSELQGKELRHYPASNTIEVDKARLRSMDATGRPTTATARQLVTNDEQSLYTLTGDVVVVREAHQTPGGDRLPRLEFRGQTITIHVNESRLESNLPVVMLRGTDRISGDSLRYTDDSRQAELQGRVRATLNTRR